MGAPRGLTGMIHVGDHYTLLHTKYVSCGPHGFRKEDFLSFSYYKSMGASDPHFSHYKSMGVHNPLGLGQFGPQGLDWQDLCRDHKTLLHTK